MPSGHLYLGWHIVTILAWVGLGVGLHFSARAVVAAMTWDQVVTWFILPAGVALILGGGGIWLSRRTP